MRLDLKSRIILTIFVLVLISAFAGLYSQGGCLNWQDQTGCNAIMVLSDMMVPISVFVVMLSLGSLTSDKITQIGKSVNELKESIGRLSDSNAKIIEAACVKKSNEEIKDELALTNRRLIDIASILRDISETLKKQP